MGLLVEYFTAPSDAAAAATIDGGGRLVLRPSDTLVGALVGSNPEQRERSAGPWSEAEELYGQAGAQHVCCRVCG